MSNPPIVFWQLPPLWGLPNPSPFCMKVETWLRMAGLPYEAKSLTRPPKSKSGKVPYLERPDGSLLSDSSTIIETLSAEHGIDLDRGLNPLERAQSVLLQRTMEEHLYFLVLYERWLDDDGWRTSKVDYFATLPAPLRLLVPGMIRRDLRKAAHGQGLARLSGAERDRRGRVDVEAISTLLGTAPYFFGRPSNIDAVAYAFLANGLKSKAKGPTQACVREYPNLVAYVERMTQRYFGDWTPPRAGAPGPALVQAEP